MADEQAPDTLNIGIGSGRHKTLQRLPDGSYAERLAVAAGAGLVTDKTGQVTFDLGSLACKPDYDDDGNQVRITYGPDSKGRFVYRDSAWGPGNVWLGDSAWTVTEEAP